MALEPDFDDLSIRYRWRDGQGHTSQTLFRLTADEVLSLRTALDSFDASTPLAPANAKDGWWRADDKSHTLDAVVIVIPLREKRKEPDADE